MRDEATFTVKSGLAEMLKGGVIMDVVNAEQARIAEDAGACAVMALERVPADIRRDGGVARMADPEMIREIQQAVSIPVMAKARIGHFVEAQVLEALERRLHRRVRGAHARRRSATTSTSATFKVPFVCGATNLGEALRRIGEGAAMIRTKGEAGTGDIVEAVRHMRAITGEIRRLALPRRESELLTAAKELPAPLELVAGWREHGKLPVVEVLRGRYRHSGRRGAHDAARRRRRVRRLGHLQVRRSRGARRARSWRLRRTGGTPGASPPPRAGLARRWRAWRAKLAGEQLLAQRGW